MAHKNTNLFRAESDSSAIKDRLMIYVRKWPIIAMFLFICVALGVLYNRYTVPKYLSSTQILIKGAETESTSTQDLVEDAVKGKRQVNLNNEVLLVKSKALLEATITKNKFNIHYYKKGKILDIDIYKDAPFELVEDFVKDTGSTIEINIANINQNGGKITVKGGMHKSPVNFKWNTPFKLDGQQYEFKLTKPAEASGDYLVKWESVKVTAQEFSDELGVKPFDSETSVLELSLKSENQEKGNDILNGLVKELNNSDETDRAKLSQTTVKFIDDRLLVISRELKGVEGNLETYQGNNQLVDIKGQSTQSLDNSNTVTKTIKDLSIQQDIVRMIRDYFANPNNEHKLVPSSLGLNDGTLSSLITQFNDLQLKKQREAPLVAANSTVMQDLNAQLSNLRGSILESLNSVTKNLQLQENSFQQQKNQYSNFLSNIPHNERVLQEIKRKQSITEGLYLYLLQKREEAAISSTVSNITIYKQINLAEGFGPVEPNARNTFIYTGLLGLILGFGLIYVMGILNDKVTDQNDIKARTPLQIIGEVGHIPKKNRQAISIFGRTVESEQFRLIRSNLYFLLKKNNGKTTLLTSSNSGEGKSFISLNLAAACAMPGKKVALLELDIRNPEISKILNLKESLGITEYLNGEVANYASLRHPHSDIPSLHIYPCGNVTMNPADLLLLEKLPAFIDKIKAEYDYVFIDSPPATLVSDAFILAQYSDQIIYVIRQNVTQKKQLDFISNASENGTFKNVSLVFNDIKNSNVKGYDKYYEVSKKSKIKKIVKTPHTLPEVAKN